MAYMDVIVADEDDLLEDVRLGGGRRRSRVDWREAGGGRRLYTVGQQRAVALSRVTVSTGKGSAKECVR